jgi:copper resistance protein B
LVALIVVYLARGYCRPNLFINISGTLIKIALTTTVLLLTAAQSYAVEINDEIQGSVSLDELEYLEEDQSTAWSSNFSLATDAHQLNLVSEGKRTSDGLEGHELRAYYSKALSSKVGINLGWRGDLNPGASRDWFLLGVSWKAPYELEIDTSLFAGSNGRLGLRLEVERGYQIMSSLLLGAKLKANFHSENDIQTGTGSGLSELELGLRLSYEASPLFSPYVGIVWDRPYGKTAHFARADGGHEGNAQFLMGLSLTF